MYADTRPSGNLDNYRNGVATYSEPAASYFSNLIGGNKGLLIHLLFPIYNNFKINTAT